MGSKANILVDDEGTARIADFGLATVIDEVIGADSSNRAGATRWMAPELVKEGLRQHTQQTDVWAYGCLFLEVRIVGFLETHDTN